MERQAHNSLKCVCHFPVTYNDLIARHRETHNKLVETHRLLMDTFANITGNSNINNLKRPRTDDLGSEASLEHPNTHPILALRATTSLETYSRSDYPKITYWTKQEWNAIQADTEKKAKGTPIVAGTRGATRSSKGENVMMLFLQNKDGTPVSGTDAAYIRDFARSIWRGFYLRGMAPETWGSVALDVKNDYIFEMEKKWEVLRYCENHWKANNLATLTYSQWYHPFDRKMKRAKGVIRSGERTSKKRRMSTEESDDMSSPHPDAHVARARSESPFEDEDIGEPSVPQVEDPGPSQVISRPRARRVANPL
jgi:hypothetical protein